MADTPTTEARLDGVCHALDCLVRAYDLGGVSASKLAEMLGYRVGDLHGAGLQAVANVTFEAGTELPEALSQRDALAAEVARLRPLAELGALALAWGRAMLECETARTVPERRNAAYDTAASAKARLATAAMLRGRLRVWARRVAEEEQKR